MSNIDVLLARLPKAKATGRDSWRAPCPAHGGDNPSTMTIRETPDGRILMHCFKGCSTHSIMDAIGLSMTDLFPEPIAHHAKPERVKFYPRDLLKVIEFEAQIVRIASYDLRAGKKLSAEDQERLEVACDRIGEALEMCDGN